MNQQPTLFDEPTFIGVRDTSKSAYKEHKSSGEADSQRSRILALLADRPAMTRAEMAKALNMRLSSVCGRTRELLNAGKLQDHPRRPCSLTGVMSHEVSIRN
jgi:Mn-dependent DtxR family transcriptional regulator